MRFARLASRIIRLRFLVLKRSVVTLYPSDLVDLLLLLKELFRLLLGMGGRNRRGMIACIL